MHPLVGSFLAIGAFWGSWAVAVANIQHTFQLSNAQLGLLLAVAICVAGLSGAFFGHLAEHWGDQLMLSVALGAWALLMAAAGVAGAWWAFATFFVACVVAGGCVDTAMNAAASQRMTGRPGSLVRFHALFNTGALTGAAVAGVVLHVGGSWRVLWPSLAVAVAALSVWTWRTRRIPGRAVPPPAGANPARRRSIRGSLGQLRLDGLLVLLVVFVIAEITEGGVDTWGVLYLRTHLAAGVLLGAGAYVAGQAIAATTRGAGGPLLGRLTPKRALVIGGVVASAGIFVESRSAFPAVAAIGLALGAGGASLFWPLVMSDVVVRARYPISATSAFTAAGYVGLVAGAPLVGWVSDAWGLNRGLTVLAGFAALVAVVSLLRREPGPARPRSQPGHVERGGL